jgi:hypothetical protein
LSDTPPLPPIPPLAITGLVDPPGELPIPFDPVPRLRNRRDGWTEEAQRAFIAALCEHGCVTSAARVVGRSVRGAYALLGSPGADSFAEAWDQALAYGIDRLRDAAMVRALQGAWVPVVRKGRLVRQEFRHNDRLAIAMLGGSITGMNIENRERASSRRAYRLYLAERRADAAERKARADAVWAEHQAILDRIEAEKNAPRRSAPPRIRTL